MKTKIDINGQRILVLDPDKQPIPIPLTIEGVAPFPERENKKDRNIDRNITFGEHIRVKITGLSAAIQNGMPSGINDAKFNAEVLVLNLNGYSLNSIRGTPVTVANNLDSIDFQLKHEEADHTIWSAILGGAWNWNREVTVAVGCPDGEVIQTAQGKGTQKLTLQLWKSPRILFMLIPTFLLIYFFLRYFAGTILRNSGVTKTRAYSLGRSQIAFWTYLILITFIAMFVISGDYVNIVSSQAMMLLGISSATTIGASVIDSNEEKKLSPEDQNKLLQLEQTNERLLNDLKRDKKGTETWLTKTAELEANKLEMDKLEQQSRGFFYDILTNPLGEINFHRYQIVIWTVVLGGVFLYMVLQNFKMPEFDATLLGLQGISSGTYLALKRQEPSAGQTPS